MKHNFTLCHMGLLSFSTVAARYQTSIQYFYNFTFSCNTATDWLPRIPTNADQLQINGKNNSEI
jgi:hypothetical protein